MVLIPEIHQQPPIARATRVRWLDSVRLLFVALVMGVTGGCAEYLPFSGGALSGEVAALPADWSDVAAAEIVQLETNPADPYSVNLWVIGSGERLYVFAGASHSDWVQDMEADPNVRLRIGTSIYELAAERVTDVDEFEWFAQAWDAKYGHRPRNENVAETWLMRLSARR